VVRHLLGRHAALGVFLGELGGEGLAGVVAVGPEAGDDDQPVLTPCRTGRAHWVGEDLRADDAAGEPRRRQLLDGLAGAVDGGGQRHHVGLALHDLRHLRREVEALVLEGDGLAMRDARGLEDGRIELRPEVAETRSSET